MKPLFLLSKGEALLGRGGLTVENLPTEFKKTFPDQDPKYIDKVSQLAGIAATRALKDSESPLPEEMRKDFAVIVGSAFGAIDSTIDFDTQALAKGPNAVNPMDFPNTVANAAGSRIGIWMQLKGPNVTLTNGNTSLLDAVGFALQGYNNGLFQRCFVGAADKVPDFLKPSATGNSSASNIQEGACFFLASASAEGRVLCRLTDYFALQLKPDLGLPKVFQSQFERLWDGVEWLGCPEEMPLKTGFPQGLTRTSPGPTVMEVGLGGLESLNAFLASSFSRGVIAVFSKPERKISFVKIEK